MRYFIIAWCFLITACENTGEQNFTVKGTLPDGRYDNTYIRFSRQEALSYDSAPSVDSALIRNGSFALSGTVEFPALYKLTIPSAVGPHHTLTIVVDKRMIYVDYDDQAASLRGGKIASRYNELILTTNRDIEEKKDAIVARRSAEERQGPLSNASMNRYNERIREAYDAQIPNLTQFVRENIDNRVGWYFFFSLPIDRYKEKDRAALYPRLPESLRARYEEKQKSTADRQAYFQQSQALMREGTPGREIVGYDVDGKRVALSDFRGKVVLVDIWASWCKPCIQEFAEIKKLRDRYKELVIIGYSVDEKKNEEAWKKALVTHELSWINLSELNGWNSRIAADYGIQAIPFTLLFDREGVIAGRNLHAHNLEAALKKQFPSE